MKKSLTQLDLIRFIYKETSATETIEVVESLNQDPLLMEEYNELFDGYRSLPKAKFTPPSNSLENILRYSEQTALNPMH